MTIRIVLDPKLQLQRTSVASCQHITRLLPPASRAVSVQKAASSSRPPAPPAQTVTTSAAVSGGEQI